MKDSEFQFDSSGRIPNFDFDDRTSYDRHDRLALRLQRELPEPGTLLLLGTALVFISRRRRR